MNVFIVCVHSDPDHSLGPAVENDIANVKRQCLKVCDGDILVYDTIYTASDLQKCASRLEEDLKKISAERVSVVLLYISGHGYQIGDKSGDERDGLDECIRLKGNIVVTDDAIHSMFVDSNLRDHYDYLVGVIDTCHSGTMLDLEQCNAQNSKMLTLKYGIVVGISSCADSQLANCDIGGLTPASTGYGGAMTIQLLDANFFGNVLSLLKTSGKFTKKELHKAQDVVAEIINLVGVPAAKLSACGQNIQTVVSF